MTLLHGVCEEFESLAIHLISVECAQCKKQLWRKPSKLKASKSGLMFCNRTCKGLAQMLDGGIKAIQPAHYGQRADLENNRYYRHKALKHLGAICVKCYYSKFVEMLDVHHLNGDRSDNKLSNLQVLCVWCHALETRGISIHDRNANLIVQQEVLRSGESQMLTVPI